MFYFKIIYIKNCLTKLKKMKLFSKYKRNSKMIAKQLNYINFDFQIIKNSIEIYLNYNKKKKKVS